MQFFPSRHGINCQIEEGKGFELLYFFFPSPSFLSSLLLSKHIYTLVIFYLEKYLLNKNNPIHIKIFRKFLFGILKTHHKLHSFQFKLQIINQNNLNFIWEYNRKTNKFSRFMTWFCFKHENSKSNWILLKKLNWIKEQHYFLFFFTFNFLTDFNSVEVKQFETLNTRFVYYLKQNKID